MKNKSIAVYRMPGESNYFSLESEFSLAVNSISETGSFYFSDFETGTKYSFQFPKLSKNNWPEFTPYYRPLQPETKKESYLKKTSELSKSIQSGEFKKVVFSKVKNIAKQPQFDLKSSFDALCKKYPEAFVYCVSSVEFGTWMGATPELLIHTSGKDFNTVSLAGTRIEKIEWTEKEREEQQIVTDYIVNNVSPFTDTIQVSEPYDLDTGSVIHLKSDITGKMTEDNSIWKLANVLHPTPAVCGIPTQLAKNHINHIEIHKRELYTGFIGPMKINSHSSLFVNLRCMQIGQNSISLYLGGGIMANSVPENEWTETENKANTLLSVLNKL